MITGDFDSFHYRFHVLIGLIGSGIGGFSGHECDVIVQKTFPLLVTKRSLLAFSTATLMFKDESGQTSKSLEEKHFNKFVIWLLKL